MNHGRKLAAAAASLALVAGAAQVAFAASDAAAHPRLHPSTATATVAPAADAHVLAQAGTPFYAPATSGHSILITGTWDGGCRHLPGGIWEHSSRTLYGHILDWTWTDYQNTSRTPDCSSSPVDVIHAIQAFATDGVSVPVSWVTSAGAPAAAPPGLTGVHTAIGLTALVSSATETPLTAARATALSRQSMCGIGHWYPGLANDILTCFTGGLGHTPFKATLLVDDTSVPGEIVIYDGLGIPSPTTYPSVLPDDFAHHRDTGQ